MTHHEAPVLVTGKRTGRESQLSTDPWAVVWIDARSATIVRWDEGPALEQLDSDVPGHRRSTGHVRHDEGIRHGGGGAPQSAGEPRRLEHVRQYVERVGARIPQDANVDIVGSGTMRYRLAVTLRRDDEHHARLRAIQTSAAPRLTAGQLTARARELNGAAPRRGYRG